MRLGRAGALLASLLPLLAARADDGRTAREKALAVALRGLARSDVALVRCGADLGPDSSRIVLARASGEALLRLLEAADPCVRTAGLVLDEEGADLEEVLVSREPLDRARTYEVATTEDLARSLGFDVLSRAIASPSEVALAVEKRTEAAARAREGFPAPSPARVLRREVLSEGSRLRIERLVFESPAPSGIPENDLVPMRVFRPLPQPRAGVLILPIWKGSGPFLEETIARSLAAEGWLAAILPLAYQFERAPPGVRSGSWTVSEDLDRTAQALRQSVADARRAAGILLGEGIDEGRLGLLGVSLGGHVGSVVYSLDDRFSAGAFLLAGGGLADAIWSASRETRRLRRALERRGTTLEELRALVEPFDPETHARAERREGALLVGGLQDDVVLPENVERLWAAYGEPALIWMPADHYTGVLFLPQVLARVRAHFERRLRPTGR